MITVLAVGWAVVVGSSVNAFAARVRTRNRFAGERPRAARRGLGARTLRLPGVLGRVVGDIARRRRERRDELRAVAQVPIVVDLVAVAIGAGHTPFHALDLASRYVPQPTAAMLARVVHSHLLGEPMIDALARLATRGGALLGLRDVLRDAVIGGPVLDSLDRLAAEERAALRRRAEARARTVPVRLLFPLVFLVLPAFALITVVPTIDAGLRGL